MPNFEPKIDTDNSLPQADRKRQSSVSKSYPFGEFEIAY